MTAMTPEQKDAYAGAVTSLARAFHQYRRETGFDAVLVGGASVVMLTGGQFFSGDFDFTAANDPVIASCMIEAGFIREDRSGYLHAGWYHPDHPMFGFQQVSGDLFDGRTERTRLLRVELRVGLDIVLPPVEDLIADRLGQHAISSRTDTSRLDQARVLAAVSHALDHTYLLRRVEEEGGDLRLLSGYYISES